MAAKRSKEEDSAVTRFREYLRINTMQPNPDYETCMTFLENQAKELSLKFQRWEGVKGKPIAILTWEGTQPELPSIILNSHTDVVPVFEDQWTYPPFEAHKDEDGNIYARGSQDMKCVGMQYLECIRRLQQDKVRLPRTLHAVFVPDEEIGGGDGMAIFIHSAEFKALKAGFALDEGLASEGEVMPVFYGERVPWWIRVRATGQPGHGSRFLENTAVSRLLKAIQPFLDFRDQQEQRLKENEPEMTIGDVTTVNLTMLNAGVQFNVVPAEASAGFDIRLPPTVDLEKFKETLSEWTSEEGVSFEFVQVRMINKATSIKEDDIWWSTFKAACDKSNVKLKPEIFPAATDSRFLRGIDIPALGFSPMNHTPILLHDHNEFLNENTYLTGIDIYCNIIPALAYVGAKM